LVRASARAEHDSFLLTHRYGLILLGKNIA
jgi:hypothetical protein